VKAGRSETIAHAVEQLKKPRCEVLRPFLSKESTLVPVPRSAKLARGSLWPSKIIADALLDAGHGLEVFECIDRISHLRKSSSSPSNQRPTVREHFDSLKVNADLIAPERITLVDDVLTMGRTMFACAMRLREAFPEAEIRAFAVFRTQGLIPNIDKLVDPSVGTITIDSGWWTDRRP